MKCCIVCALYYFLLCVTKRIVSFLPLSTVLPAAWSKKKNQCYGTVLLSLPAWQWLRTAFPSDFARGRKKRGTLLVSSKLLCKVLHIYIYIYICIYIDPIIAMLFISAFSDLFSRKHNQVVEKNWSIPFQKTEKSVAFLFASSEFILKFLHFIWA